MQKLILTILVCFIFSSSFAQSQRQTSGYLQGQFTKTLQDRTKPNNPWGMGFGLQVLFNTSSKLRPAIDLTLDAFLEDDKVLRMNSDGTAIDAVGAMVNLFGGVSYHAGRSVYLSVLTGPSYVGGQLRLGVKPAVGFSFSPDQRWTGRVSYINVFDRDERTKEDFSSLSLSLGVRVF